ncbi:MAG TPA: hypothetical protein VGP93_07095 [Polyangiaceae bacterium]|jgi:hypothetical protein|nr:hypothetical protein [Polyangiaceae bacterium]
MLLALHAEPAVDEASLPALILYVDLILCLLEANEPKLAQDIFATLQKRMSDSLAGGNELPPNYLGRLALIAELMALLGVVPERMVRALARGTLSANFLCAVQAVEEAGLLGGPAFPQVFRERAPNLFAAVWPMVTRHSPGTVPRSQVSPAFRTSWLKWNSPRLLMVGAVLFTRLLTWTFSDGSDKSSRHDSSNPKQQAMSEVRVARPDVRGSEAQVTRADEREFRLAAQALDDAILRRDCVMVREQLPLFEAAFARVERLSELAPARLKRRELARATCPDPKGLLSNP